MRGRATDGSWIPLSSSSSRSSHSWACTVHHHPRVAWAIGEPLTNVCIALTVDRCIQYNDGPVGRALNWAPLAYVGTLSYSLYLWQQPFLDRSSTVPFLFFPLNVALAFVAALLSYYLVERPCLLARARSAAPRAEAILGGLRRSAGHLDRPDEGDVFDEPPETLLDSDLRRVTELGASPRDVGERLLDVAFARRGEEALDLAPRGTLDERRELLEAWCSSRTRR